MTRRPTFGLLALASLALVSTACQLPPFLPEFQVNTSDTDDNYANDVAMSEHGDFIVDLERVHARTSKSSGGASTPTRLPPRRRFPMNANTALDRESSSIARDASGRFVIVWSEDQNQIWGQRWDSDGTPLGDNFQINTLTARRGDKPLRRLGPLRELRRHLDVRSGGQRRGRGPAVRQQRRAPRRRVPGKRIHDRPSEPIRSRDVGDGIRGRRGSVKEPGETESSYVGSTSPERR